MKPISQTIISCGLMLAAMQCAIAADAAVASAPPATSTSQAAKKPAKVTVNEGQLRKRLEDRGIQAKKRSALARKKALERQNPAPAAGK